MDAPTEVTPPPKPDLTPSQAVDSLWNPSFIMAIIASVIVAGVVMAAFRWGDSTMQSMVTGSMTTAYGSVLAFYFSSTKNSQNKDATIAEQRKALDR